ncbi:MATE family efflux transporter [Neofamilia massiliensis]|uniref:MATE family efflux transporter n=1 Tax=Neofamilia massiliensis TaxID=1673724 RepID=UPI0006BB6FD9|nr:MATE family efflux transporter [Neofamilia massiliensis]
MTEKNYLLHGDIKKTLIKMALPLMGISFIQITYNLVDMFWLGRYSDSAVAAVGTAGLINYIGNSLAMIGRVGAATWISQSYGRRDYNNVIGYVENGFKVNIFISLLYTIIAALFMNSFLDFFTLTETVRTYAVEYLRIQIAGMLIVFLNPMFAVSYNSMGDSVTPFKLSVIGLVLNFIMDPLFIHVFNMGVKGVALATVLAQAVVLIIFIVISKKDEIMGVVDLKRKTNMTKVKNIVKVGLPVSVQSTGMAIIASVLNTFISRFGPMPMAVFSLGVQIESICWMTADGFAVAVTSFMGQNLGAENYDRMDQGFKEAIKLFILIGAIASSVLIFFGENLIGLFMPGDPAAIAEGGRLLKIMGASEVLMAIEIGITGALSGVGLTRFPAINGLVGNSLRIPLALILMPHFGVLAIWMVISMTMAIKGISSMIAYQVIKKKTQGFRVLPNAKA